MLNLVNSKPGVILLAEDDRVDQRLTIKALTNETSRNVLFIVEDGMEAMEYLRREGIYADSNVSPRPDLILLDINMPRMNGKEVLREMKKDADLSSIPVVMMTTSDDMEDITEAYNLGVNAYITKPEDLDQLVKIMQSLENFWLNVVVPQPNMN